MKVQITLEKWDIDVIHDIILEALELPESAVTDKIVLRYWELFPEELKYEAVHHGIDDTVVRENIHKWIINDRDAWVEGKLKNISKAKKKLVVFTGAGISKESGIPTFRDSDGLWENYKIEDVATMKGWLKNKTKVLTFYNERRAQLKNCQPNEAHKLLAELEKHFDVQIITQNVDNLHERAGSTKVLHLHGELTKARTLNDDLIVDVGYDNIYLKDKLRPHIVWFGENVMNITEAQNLVSEADIFVIIGTSMQVYPAAGIVNYVPDNSPIYLIDPTNVWIDSKREIEKIHKGASEGVKILVEKLVK